MKKILFLFVGFTMFIMLMGHKVSNTTDADQGIAGTYITIKSDGANILQLTEDGNMTFIMSDQFINKGIVGESYSNTKGNWKEIGERQIAVSTVDVTFKDGKFAGVAYADYTIEFDENYEVAYLNCQGAIYPPGVDPMAADAQPIDGSQFKCQKQAKFKRVRSKIPN